MKSVELLLQPFLGYVELGMYAEALEELDNLPEEVRAHPVVLTARMDYFIETHHWEEGIRWGEKLCEQCPKESEFWIKRAYCLHELKRTQEAKDVLLQAPRSHRKLAIYLYNLACYESQLGNLPEARALLKSCFAKDPAYRKSWKADPDLQPLRETLET